MTEGCLEAVDVPDQLKAAVRPLRESVVDEFPWEAPTICELRDGHMGNHIGHFGPSHDHSQGRGALWAVWGEGLPVALRAIPICDHSGCDHPKDYYCYGCRLPRGHDGNHAGLEG